MYQLWIKSPEVFDAFEIEMNQKYKYSEKTKTLL